MFSFDPNSYQPFQLYQLSSAETRFTLYPPPKEYQDRIHYFWALEILVEQVKLPILPDNAIDFVVSAEPSEFVAVYPSADALFHIPIEGPSIYFGVCIQPKAFPSLTGIEPKLVPQQALSKEQVGEWGFKPLIEGLGRCKTISQGIKGLESHFCHERKDLSKACIDSEIILNVEEVLTTSVTQLARKLNVSDRSLRRHCDAQFGFGPKKVATIIRFQNFVRAFLTDDPSVAGVDGYFDDAHRIKELKILTGLTPTQLRKLSDSYNP